MLDAYQQRKAERKRRNDAYMAKIAGTMTTTVLQLEALWELWIEAGIAYEPWVQKRKSTYSTSPTTADEF